MRQAAPAGHPRVGADAYSGRVSRADETFLDLALSRSTVDRSAASRNDSVAVAQALLDPRTRVLPLVRGTAPVRAGERPTLALRPPAPGDDDLVPWLLGIREGTTYLAVEEPSLDEDAGSSQRSTGVQGTGSSEDRGRGATQTQIVRATLREIGADLDDTDAGLLTTATALAEWHHRHGHCPRCGAATTVVQGGWVRRCPVDGSEHHPRTDPAVIMAVTDADDRLLLGTGVTWPQDRVSVLAGFVEAGESLEAAVVREVREEVGIPVTNLVYRGNQPWPFPASLMLGFRARAEQTQLRIDPVELRSAGWFTREELASAVASGRRTLPTRVSIARRLIEEWFGGSLDHEGTDRPS